MSTEYALRMLYYMSQRGTGQFVKMQELADDMKIPITFLPKVTRKLKDEGWVGSKSGADGGLYLLKSLSEITFLEVIQCMETSVKCNICLEEDKECTRGAEKNCPFRRWYEALQKHMEEQYLSTTLADIINGNSIKLLAARKSEGQKKEERVLKRLIIRERGGVRNGNKAGAK